MSVFQRRKNPNFSRRKEIQFFRPNDLSFISNLQLNVPSLQVKTSPLYDIVFTLNDQNQQRKNPHYDISYLFLNEPKSAITSSMFTCLLTSSSLCRKCPAPGIKNFTGAA